MRYRGKESGVKPLPGGGPQGTLLGLLLFIVLINDVGFEGQTNDAGEIITSRRNMKKANEMHLKYVDDLTLLEAINLPKQLESVPEDVRPQPDNYHARFGHILPVENSLVYQQLLKTMEYSVNNEMKINFKKTKAMLFNPCTSVDVVPDLRLDGHELEVVEELRLLGIIIRSDMKWTSNSENMVTRANRRLWILRRLKSLGAKETDLIDMYVKHIRCVVELAVPAWHGAITLEERTDIERIQKSAAHIIMGDDYISYKCALMSLNLDSLESRHNRLCIKFAKKAEKHEKFQKWFKLMEYHQHTRLDRTKYCKLNLMLSTPDWKKAQSVSLLRC